MNFNGPEMLRLGQDMRAPIRLGTGMRNQLGKFGLGKGILIKITSTVEQLDFNEL